MLTNKKFKDFFQKNIASYYEFALITEMFSGLIFNSPGFNFIC